MIFCPVTPARWLQHCGRTNSHQTPACSSLQRCLHKCPPADNWDGSMQQACHHCHQDAWAHGQQSSMNKICSVMFYLHISKFINTYLHLPRPSRHLAPLRTIVMTATSVSTTNTQGGADTLLYIFIHFVKTFPNR